MRSAPPSPELAEKIEAKVPLTMSEYRQAGYLNERLSYLSRRNQMIQQGQNPPDYSPESSIIPMLNRIFAAPTDGDIQKLMMLPADILYKVAEEGKYIEPEAEAEKSSYTEESEPASKTTSDDSKKSENLFGSFNFDIQGGSNPFLSSTAETPTEETTTTTEKPATTTTTEKVTTTTEATTMMTKEPEIISQPSEKKNSNSEEQLHKNHQKPYFYYTKNNQDDSTGKWVLVVPPTENDKPPKISVEELVELSRSLVKASERSGMNSNVDELPPQLFHESKPAKEEKKEKPIESNLPIASFVQEAESQVEEKEKIVSQLTPNEITIGGKVYKLADENPPKKPRNKKQRKHMKTTTTTTPAPVVLKTAAPEEIKPASSSSALTDLYRHLNPEEEKILLELQRRIIQQQQNEVAQMMNQQPTVSANPGFAVNREPINVPQQHSISSQPILNNYYAKMNPPLTTSHALTTAAPSRVLIHQIGTEGSELPMRRQYSLRELEEYYEAQQAFQKITQEPVQKYVEPTTSRPDLKSPEPEIEAPERVFRPHKQIKIQMNSESKAPTKVIQTTQVDSIADTADRERERVIELRRQFALERQQLSERLKTKINRSTVLQHTTPAPSVVTEHHCYNIRSFARQFGAKNVMEYAFTHCHYIENYYPDLKCENVKDYMAVCKQYYSTRRMLFFT
ncbi:hypothetical protein FO519_000197 [Halicephalobus sp. NKZ332]|nr:hypothetical protein FO519_000197 [Halicephalobus sp. NKZ332]